MKLIWSIDILDKYFWHYLHGCKPIIWQNKLYYAFRSNYWIEREIGKDYCGIYTIQEIDLSTLESKIKELKLKETDGKTSDISGWFPDTYRDKYLVHDSSNWSFNSEGSRLYLNIGAYDLIADEENISIFKMDKNFIKPEFHEITLIKDEYHFEDKIIKYNQKSIIECFDKVTNKKLWRLKIKAYLYTPIKVKNNFIYFGTAGNGGAFYFVALNTGDVKTFIDNGNASEFIWYGNSVIIQDNKSVLIQLNPMNGDILSELKPPNKIGGFSNYYIHNDRLYARTYCRKSKTYQITCVELLNIP